jgi:hypothetical protein
MGVLGASLLSFDKLKMLLLLNCPLRDVYIPLLGVQSDDVGCHMLVTVAPNFVYSAWIPNRPQMMIDSSKESIECTNVGISLNYV